MENSNHKKSQKIRRNYLGKKFKEVNYNDKICTLNIKTDRIEFQAPQRISNYIYKGKMYKLKTKRIDLLVTPNHRLLYSPCDFRNPKPYILKEAQYLFKRSKRLKKDGTWIGESPEYFRLPEVKIKHGSRYYSGFRNKKENFLPIKPWLKFFGFWGKAGYTYANGHRPPLRSALQPPTGAGRTGAPPLPPPGRRCGPAAAGPPPPCRREKPPGPPSARDWRNCKRSSPTGRFYPGGGAS